MSKMASVMANEAGKEKAHHLVGGAGNSAGVIRRGSRELTELLRTVEQIAVTDPLEGAGLRCLGSQEAKAGAGCLRCDTVRRGQRALPSVPRIFGPATQVIGFLG